ncbi:MAG: hypothetical protein EOO41_04165 [Methanobacteriota archaeon]|nr:MAG: hypothetical protein EOO41_04165 [Euryarchaeota archaeon]
MRRHSSAGSEEDEVDTSSGNKLAGIVGVESRASPPSTSRRYLAAPSHAKPANSITNKVVADKLQFFDSCVDVQRRWPGDDGFGMEHCSLIEVGQYGPRVTATMYQRCICGADASALVRQLHSKAGALLPAGAARAKLANMMGQPLAAAPAHAVAGLVAVPPAVGPLAAGRGVKGTAPSAAVRETEAGDAIPPKAHTFGSRKPSAINMPMEHLLNEMRTRSSSTVDSGANELAVKDEAARGHRRVETIASDRVDSKRTTHLDRDAALALGAGSVDDMHVGADFMRGSEAGTNQRAVYACRFCGLSWQPHVIPNISPPLPLASGPMNTLDLDGVQVPPDRPDPACSWAPMQAAGAARCWG